MAQEFDPEAPMGWIGEDENRRPITYPCSSWFASPFAREHAIATDPAARWYFRGEYPLPPAPPTPPPQSATGAPVAAGVALDPRLVTPGAAPAVVPAPAAAPVASVALAPPPPQQQQQQQQQQQPPRTPPGYRRVRNDRLWGCSLCAWTGDRRAKAETHVGREHEGTPLHQGVVDLGMIRARFERL